MENRALQAPPVKFLREDTVAEDMFGAHRRLAKAMASTLLLDPPLRVVGLLGRWGSGKSRVVSLIRAELGEHPVRFFTFDAWLDQSDAPRRAFLERLLQWISDEKLGPVDKLQAELNRLLGKAERTDTTVTPRVAPLLGLVLSVLLLIPLATQFLRADWMEKDGVGTFSFWGRELALPFGVAFVVAILPFVLVVLVTLGHLLRVGCGRAWRWLRMEPEPEREVEMGSSVVALFANKVSEQRTDVKTRDPDPTALEFQRFMVRVMDHLAERTSDRLVFVVDNLDRLQASEVLVLWSTIRGLFHGQLAAAGQRPPTVLFPLDEEALRRLNPSDKAVADGFTEKTFDVVFRLPPPVHSQWQSYLGERIDEVFERNVRPGWKDAAARVLEEATRRDPTPRSINAFVNEVATLWLQWHREPVSFAAMAYYAANRRHLDEDSWEGLGAPLPWMESFDPDWALGVAALRYGALPHVAGQILIHEPVRKAVVDYNVTAFTTLSQQVGFRVVFRRLADTFRAGVTGVPLSHAALLLARVSEPSDPDIDAAWQSLIFGFIHQRTWAPRLAQDVEGLTILLERTPSYLRSQMLEATAVCIGQVPPHELKSSAQSVIAALDVLVAASERFGVDAPSVRLQPGSLGVLDLLGAATPDSPALGALKSPEPGAELLRALLERVEAAPRAADTAHLVSTLAAWRNDLDWSEYVEPIASRLGITTQGLAHVPELEALAVAWARAPDAHDLISDLVDQPLFRRALQTALERDTAEAPIRMALFLAASRNPELPPEGIAAFVRHKVKLGSAVDHALAFTAPLLTGARMLELARERTNLQSVLTPVLQSRLSRRPADLSSKEAVAHLELIEELGLMAEASAWRTIAGRAKFWTVVKQAAPPAAARRAALAALDLDLSNSELAPVASTLAHALEHIPASQWRNDILHDGELAQSLEILAGIAPDLTLAGDLEAAVTSLVEEVLNEDQPGVVRRWNLGATRLPKKAYSRVLKLLAAGVLRPSAADPHHLFDVMGERLFTVASVVEDPDLFLQRMVKPLLLDRKNLDWIVRHIKPLAVAGRKASPDVRAQLQTLIPPILADGLTAPQRRALETLQARFEEDRAESGIGG